MKKIIKSIICLALACLVAMSLAATVSFAGKADSASDGLYMSGSNVVCGEGVTLTETESGLWTLTKENVTAEDKMEFSLYAALPEDGAYKLEIASSAGAGISINDNSVTLPQASMTRENGLNVYSIRNAEFNRGTNEIKFSVEDSQFNLGYVNITAYSDSLSGADYSYTSNAWVTDASTDYNGTTYNYQSFNGVVKPFCVEYTFYVKEDGEYSLDAIMSYPVKSGYTDARNYSTASVMCDGILADNVTSEDWRNKMLGKNVYSGLMLKKGIHTLTVTPDITTESKKYNLYVGDLNFTKTGDYVNTGIEIMGNEYTSLGGMVLYVKNDLTMVSTGETFTDWKFFKEDMTATDTDTVTYSFDVQKAGYYSFEGWINSNSNIYVSASKLLIDSKEYSLTEDSTVTKDSNGSGVYITKKTISNKEPKLWLDEGKHTVELVISPRTDDNAQINARVWKLAFTLISDDDIYIPAINYVDESAIAPTVAASAFKDEAMEYYSFRDDNMTDEFVLTYKFTPSVTAKYTFEGWASAIYSYLSEPKFYLDGIQMETEEDKSIKSEDGFIRRHFAEGIELTAGQEYTLKVKSQPKISGGKINAKLWKMTFNREVGESYMTSVINDNNSLKGSFFVKSQSQAKDAYVLYAQYDKDGRFLDVVIEDFELKQSDNFSGTSFTVDLPENADSAIKSKLFIMTTDLYPLFNAMELKSMSISTENDEVIRIEAENYSDTNSPLTVTENEKMSGGKHITMSTTAKPMGSDGYYVTYEVNLDEAGGYFFTIDTYPLVTNSYSELKVSVNGGKVYDLYEDAYIGTTRSGSKLSAIEVPAMSGFKQGKNTIKVMIPYSRPRDNRYNFNIDCITLKKTDWTVEKIEILGDSAENIIEKGNSATVQINYSEKSEENRKLKVKLTDYYDDTVMEKDILVSSGDILSELQLPSLDIGWYKLSVYEEKECLDYANLCVVKPLNERKQNYTNERFGMDATLGNLGFRDSVEDLCKSLRLAGVQWVRERLDTQGYSESDGSYSIDNAGNSKYAYTMLKKYGLKVHSMITGTPEYLMTDEAKGDIVSSDLIGLYNLHKQMGDDYVGLVDSWELQNEPEAVHDLSPSETGDKFHNMMKAMSIGFQDSKSEALITTSGFGPVNANILDLFFRNETYKYVDVLTHHGHTSYVGNVSLQTLPHTETFNVNDLIEKYGVKDMEVWDDEAGINIGDADDIKPQRRQAEYTVISNVQALRYAEKFFVYFFKHKQAGASVYDTKNHGPRRAYASYSAMTDILGEANYLGDVKGLLDNEYGYVFENGDKNIMVLFASSETKIKLPIENAEIIDIQGRNKEPYYDEDGQLIVDISPEPVYVRVQGEISKDLYEDVTKKDARSLKKELSVAERVIVAQEYPEKTRLDAKTQGYKISDDNTTVTVKVSNLNDTSVSGVIKGEVHNGWNLYPETQQITISPYSEAVLKFRLEKTDEVVGNLTSGIKFYGEFEGAKTSVCETDIFSPDDIAYKEHRAVEGFTDDKNWSDLENIAGDDSTINITSKDNKINFKYDFDYNATDLWAYPKFMLDSVIDLSGADGFILKYEAPQNFRDLSIGMGLYVYEQQGGTWLTKSFQWMSEGEGEILMPFEEFKLTSGEDADYQLSTDDIIGFSLGVNSRLAPSPVRDIPEFKIVSLKTYTVTTEDEGYSEITKVYPEEGAVYKTAPEILTVEFSDDKSKLVCDTVYVYIDGILQESTALGNKVSVNMPSLTEGEHKVKISYRLDGTKAFIKEYSFFVDSDYEDFADLNEAEWAREEIEYLSRKGIVSGTGNGYFEPNISVSNAEFVKMLVNAFGVKKSANGYEYKDIPVDAWYKEYVAAAYNANILNDVYNERFNGDSPINRQDMAVLLYRAAKSAGYELTKKNNKIVFNDKEQFSDYATEAISILQMSGVLKGVGEDYFKPLNSLTRAEAAVAIYNVLNIEG